MTDLIKLWKIETPTPETAIPFILWYTALLCFRIAAFSVYKIVAQFA